MRKLGQEGSRDDNGDNYLIYENTSTGRDSDLLTILGIFKIDPKS